MTTDCRAVEGLLAAAMYEPLSAGDRERIDAHLDECVVCRETVRDLETLVRTIPPRRAELETDLLPAVRDRLGSEAPGRARRSRRYVAAAAAAAALLFAAIGGGYAALNADAPAAAGARDAEPRRISPLDRTFQQAERLLEARFYGRAYLVLDTAAKRYPDDVRAPEALQRAAELAFHELHRYPAAHAALRELRDRYPEQFASTEANRIALEMLEEAYAPNGDYLALRLLNEARAHGDFDAYERVLSRYPGTYIAGRALDEMAAALTHGNDVVTALETLADTCTHPVAVAQVKLKLARTLDEQGHPRERVRALYEDAAASESVVLAGAAREALQQIDRR